MLVKQQFDWKTEKNPTHYYHHYNYACKLQFCGGNGGEFSRRTQVDCTTCVLYIRAIVFPATCGVVPDFGCTQVKSSAVKTKTKKQPINIKLEMGAYYFRIDYRVMEGISLLATATLRCSSCSLVMVLLSWSFYQLCLSDFLSLSLWAVKRRSSRPDLKYY